MSAPTNKTEDFFEKEKWSLKAENSSSCLWEDNRV